MRQQKSKVEEECVCVDHEDNQQIYTNDNSNPQQGTTTLSSRNIHPTTKAKKDCNSRKTPAIYTRPERRISRGKEGLRTSSSNIQSLQHSDTKKNLISDNNVAPQLKIPPYKRDSRKLFVGGLPAGLTGDEFRSIFEKFGSILDSVVIIDRNTKRSRGFGFVTFEDPIVAHKLLHSNVPVKDKPRDGSFRRQTPEGDRIDNSAHVTTAGLSGSIFIRGKKCEIKASEPKEPSQIPRSSSDGTGGSEAQNNYKTTSFDGVTSPVNYSGPPPSYPYQLCEQIQVGGNFYHYPNGNSGHVGNDGEQLPSYAQPSGVDGGTYNDVNSYDKSGVNGEQLSPYAEPFRVCDGGNGMMAYRNEFMYPQQPFAYGNELGNPHNIPHVYPYGAMLPHPTAWPYVPMNMPPYSPVAYSAQDEEFEYSGSVGDRS